MLVYLLGGVSRLIGWCHSCKVSFKFFSPFLRYLSWTCYFGLSHPLGRVFVFAQSLCVQQQPALTCALCKTLLYSTNALLSMCNVCPATPVLSLVYWCTYLPVHYIRTVSCDPITQCVCSTYILLQPCSGTQYLIQNLLCFIKCK